MITAWSKDLWNAYKGDGCTGIPDLYLETPCERHDRHYTFHTHKDGTPITRLEADWELAKDAWKALPVIPKGPLTVQKVALIPVRAIVKPIAPIILFVGVRIFGGGANHWGEE